MADYIRSFSNYSAQGIEIRGEGDYYFPETLPQMYISANFKNFFLSDISYILRSSYYGASVIGVLVMALVLELLHFTKWYMIVRKRITSNCLNSLIDLNKDKEQFKKEQRKIRLKVIEKMTVSLLHFLIKALNLIIIIIIMATYNIGYIIAACIGMFLGNLLFGLIKDSIVIRRIKKERKVVYERKQIQMTELLSKSKQLNRERANSAATQETDRF